MGPTGFAPMLWVLHTRVLLLTLRTRVLTTSCRKDVLSGALLTELRPTGAERRELHPYVVLPGIHQIGAEGIAPPTNSL